MHVHVCYNLKLYNIFVLLQVGRYSYIFTKTHLGARGNSFKSFAYSAEMIETNVTRINRKKITPLALFLYYTYIFIIMQRRVLYLTYNILCNKVTAVTTVRFFTIVVEKEDSLYYDVITMEINKIKIQDTIF